MKKYERYILKQCLTCDSPNINYVVENRIYDHAGKKIIVPNVPHEHCLDCDDRFFGPEACEILDFYLPRSQRIHKRA